MADEDQVADVTEAEVAEAKQLGWADKDAWKGNPDHWVDARTFLDRGRHVLPIVQENNKRLKGEVQLLREQLATSNASIQAANAAIEALQESHDKDVQEQVEAARAELKEQLAEASRDGDHKQVAELTDKLTQLNAADKAAKDDGKEDKKPAPGAQVAPDILAWNARNSEFVADPRRMALAQVEAVRLRQEGETSIGAAFLDKVAAKVDEILGAPRKGGTGKVESGNGGSGRGSNGGGSSGAKSYSDLPADAKTVCDRMAQRLVGPNRAHKDLNSWRASYAKQYFQGE